MIYMTHPEHGAMHVYSESEAATNEARGWIRTVWPPAPKVQTVGLAVGLAPERKKPGPKPKAQ